MTREQLLEQIAIREEIDRRHRENKFGSLFPETGPLRREFYPRHMEFFRLGATRPERMLCAGNRVGKTQAGAYEVVAHATGLYPPWWEGRRFEKEVSIWASGQSAKTTRDIIQYTLLGSYGNFGSGMIPKSCLIDTTPKAGVPQAVETIFVKHVSGGRSEIQLKSYDSGIESYYGVKKDCVWLDEDCESDPGIYSECLTRTMSTIPGERNGLVLFTLTPISGLTPVLEQFLEAPADGTKVTVSATWDDVPHLTQENKDQLWNSLPPYQRDARSKGIPHLAGGLCYPVPDEEVFIRPFDIPRHWPIAFGLDVGWTHPTAAVWGAIDRDNDVIFLFAEYKRGTAEFAVHAAEIKARGENVPGWIDPASAASSVIDGRQLLTLYRAAGLSVTPAANAVNAGICAVHERLCAGRLKIFSSLGQLYKEFKMYRRLDDGKIYKQNDDLCDAMRYLIMSDTRQWKTRLVIHDAPRRNGYEGAGFFGR